MNTSESSPIFSSRAIARMLSALFVPVGDEAGDVAALQHHFGMLLERLHRVGFVVLGADGQDDAAAAEFAGVFLEGGIGLTEGAALAEGDALQPVIADDAAPDGVVQVEHQAFERPALLGRDPAADEVAVERRGGRRRPPASSGATARCRATCAMPSRRGALIDRRGCRPLPAPPSLRIAWFRRVTNQAREPGRRCSLLPRTGQVHAAGRPAGGSGIGTPRAPGARRP